ncbi:MAG: SMC family ATPase [Clostridia bacterium]|nr:SMC family ATPase [Clostridia bacterium]
MRPERLEFCGLKSYSEKAVVDFTRLTADGLFGVFGDTGSGKSTILDAMFYALYGRFAAVVNNDELVNAATGAMYVDFTFSVIDGGSAVRYRVRRDYKIKSPKVKTQPPAKATLSRLDGEIEYRVAENVSAVNDKVTEILGLGFDEFIKCIILPQGKFSAFLTAAKGDRLKVISSLFDLDKYGVRLSAAVNASKRDLEVDCEREKALFEEYSSFTLEALKAASEDVSKAEQDHKTQDVIYAKIKQDFSDYKENYVRHNELEEQKKNLNKINALAPVMAKKEKLLSAYHKAVAVVEAEKNLKRKESRLKEENERHSAHVRELAAVEKEYASLEKEMLSFPALKESASGLKSVYDSLYLLSSDYDATCAKKAERAALIESYKRVERQVAEIEGDVRRDETEFEAASLEVDGFFFADKISAAIDRISFRSRKKFVVEETEFLSELKKSLEEAPKALVQSRIDKLSALIEGVEGDEAEELSAVRIVLEQNDALIRSREDAAKKLADDKMSLGNAKAELESIKQRGTAVKAEIDAFDEKFSALRKRYSSFMGEPLPADYKIALKTAKDSADRARDSVETLSKKCEDVKNALPVKRVEVSKSEERLADFKDEVDALKKELDLKCVGITVESAKATVAQVDDYEVLKDEIDKYNADKSATENLIKKYSEGLPDLDYSKERYLKFSEEVERAGALNKQLYEKYIKFKNICENISQNYKKRCTIEEAYMKKRDEKRVYDVLSEAVRANKFVAFVVDEYLFEVCVDAESLLAVLSSGRYGLTYEDDFYVVDYLNGGQKRKTSTVSGGELFLVSLSLALALSKKMIAKSSRPIEFFFLDEGFGSLDASLAELVVDSLEKLKGSNFTIGLISHVEALKERINAKITVSAPTMTKGSSITVSV